MLSHLSTGLQRLSATYDRAPLSGKVLAFLILMLLLMMVARPMRAREREPFAQNDKFLFKTGPDVYDDFYADIYDYLVFNNFKDEYEVGEIINKTTPSAQSRILDVGSGTGHHTAMLGAKHLDVLGIDLSPSMVAKAKANYPQYDFRVADALDGDALAAHSFTHILCLYFTIYYFPDKAQFFENCMRWLMPGGHLVVHLVDRGKFDPILPPGNPLLMVSPQKYARERITTTQVKFTDFTYNADFQLDPRTDTAKFVEKFRDDAGGKVRKNEHVFYMENVDAIVRAATDAGFILEEQVDLVKCQYEYQYLYVFTKPA